ALLRSIARLGDVQPRRVLVQVLHVLDLPAAVYRDRRREPLIEKFALIVADDNHGLRRGLLEFLPERLHGAPALLESFAADLNRGLLGKSRRAFLQKTLEIVGLAPVPVLLVFAIRFRAQIPLLGRRRKQRPVRRSNTQNDFSHSEF